MNAKYIVTWDAMQAHGRTLASKVMPITKWKGIIAVTRGGLFPAGIVARELNIRNIQTVCIASYDHDQQHDLSILYSADGDGEGFLILDDLVDTGETAKVIKQLYPKGYLATIFAKPQGRQFVDNYVVDIPQDVWIEQPWDLGLEFVPPIARK